MELSPVVVEPYPCLTLSRRGSVDVVLAGFYPQRTWHRPTSLGGYFFPVDAPKHNFLLLSSQQVQIPDWAVANWIY